MNDGITFWKGLNGPFIVKIVDRYNRFRQNQALLWRESIYMF
jgi:hypothetical protein